MRLCGSFRVLAQTRNCDGQDWGLLLSWADPDGKVHEWAMPLQVTGGDGVEVRKAFLSGGLYVTPVRSGRDRLNSYLAEVRVATRAKAVNRTGWHDQVFVFPDEVLGKQDRDRVRLQMPFPVTHAFRTQGDLAGWNEEIGRFCIGNSRLAFAVSLALASPFLRLLDMEGGGFHLVGPSSSGKSTALLVAASVWGGGPDGFHRTWRATGNGLEGIALLHNDALLVLDELGQVDGREAGEIAYMLANGQGKSRSREDGGARPVRSWRLLFLSTGEVGLEDKLIEAGKKIKAGQAVRFVEIPADPASGHGLFETLHRFDDGRGLSDHLRRVTQHSYGSPIRAFLGEVIPELPGILISLKGVQSAFVAQMVDSKADGQVARVASRFALVAAVGEMARTMGVLPWPEWEAYNAAATCFRSWMNQRGSSLSIEVIKGVAAVREFLERFGASRFEAAWEERAHSPIINRAGYRRLAVGAWEYLLFPDVLKKEILSGSDARPVLSELARQGILIAPSKGWATQLHVPGYGKPKLYCLRPSDTSQGDE